MAQNVTENRNLYIGGSDIPIIMGISPFKTRFDLLLEKAQLQENEFKGNEYTEYGNILEPQIRDYINKNSKNIFVEDKKIINDIRCHVDGFNQKDTILEIKTTSQIHELVDGYRVYLVQLLFYMSNYNVKKGKLAVYERPKDFNVEFDEERLEVFDINIKDHKELVEEIWQAVEQFRMDLNKIKENPFLTEEDLQPKKLIKLANEVVSLEKQLASYKEIENKYKLLKTQLYETMEEFNIKKWTTNNGTQITRVLASEDTIVKETIFNETKFKEENKELYDQYLEEKETVKKGRAGYVKITIKN